MSGDAGITRFLDDTPYLPGESAADRRRFEAVAAKSIEVRERVDKASKKLATLAQEAIVRVQEALRAEQIAESNRIEYYDWTATAVEDVIRRSEDLLNAPIRDFLDSVRADPRAFEALGLVQAHRIADEIVAAGRRPGEVEIRQLHQMIMAGQDGAGEYRTRAGTQIAEQEHEPPHPLLVPQQMREFAQWWQDHTGHPVLTATVAHAWLTHIHPFEDGNGRMARLLANVALVSEGYPPLIVRSRSDRARYYDALATSDTGNILPLFSLFAKMQERVAARLSRDEYLSALVERTFLASTRDRFLHWTQAFNHFRDAFRLGVNEHYWSFTPQGFPEIEEFELLTDRDPAGNLWWAKVADRESDSAWLAWFGYCSNELTRLLGAPTGYPSLFLSPRDDSPEAIHPYRLRLGTHVGLDTESWEEWGEAYRVEVWIPNEISVIPGVAPYAVVRCGREVTKHAIADAARLTAERLAGASPFDDARDE
jgi:Fic family protein